MKVSAEIQQILLNGLKAYNNDPELLKVYPRIVDYICRGYLKDVKNIKDVDDLCYEFIGCLRHDPSLKELGEIILSGGPNNSLGVFLSNRLNGSSIGKNAEGVTCILGPMETLQLESKIKQMAGLNDEVTIMTSEGPVTVSRQALEKAEQKILEQANKIGQEPNAVSELANQIPKL